MDYTSEQAIIIKENAPLTVVKALAGTGKTSTLLGYARLRKNVRMLYIVLNKSVQKEAEVKFRGTGVKPVTSHALAYRYTGVQYQHKLVSSLKPYEVANALGISKELHREIGYYGSQNDTLVIASVVLETLTKFLYSTDTEIQAKHINENYTRLLKILGLDENAVRQIIIIQARKLWAKMIDVQDGTVGMLHDGYLKLFQLSNPVLSGYDEFLVDESQDMNSCTMSIIFKQRGKITLVGDDFQAIYGWRGAKNALSYAASRGAIVHYLTGSFRFGENIARIANIVLAIRGATHFVRGLGGKDRLGNIPEDIQRTVISRTNAGVFSHTAQAINNQKTWWHVGGSEGYRFDQILDVYYLWKRMFDLIRDPFIRSFTDFMELKLYVDQVGDPELKPRCKIAEDYGDQIPEIIEKIKGKVGSAFDLESADVVLSTAHKAKGLEFPHVQLDDDYIELCEIQDMSKLNEQARNEELKKISEDLNILYVAITRAQKTLQLNFDLLSYLSRNQYDAQEAADVDFA